VIIADIAMKNVPLFTTLTSRRSNSSVVRPKEKQMLLHHTCTTSLYWSVSHYKAWLRTIYYGNCNFAEAENKN